MLVSDVVEGYKQIFGRKGSSTVRKYRCTSGARRGRIVAKATTCNAPLNPKKSQKFKATRARTKSLQKLKSRITKRSNPASRRLKHTNVGRRRLTRRSRGRKI